MKIILRTLFIIIIIAILLLVNIAVAKYSYSSGGLDGPTKNPQIVKRYSPHSMFFYYGGYYHYGKTYRGVSNIGHK